MFSKEAFNLNKLHRQVETSVFFLLVVAGTASSFNSHRIIVAKDGSGQFRSITEAVDSLPMFNYERITIVIKNGVYHEKIRIDQDYITLEGENKDSTIIEYPQLRTDWIAHRDPIGPAVVNIHGDDDILRNLTIKNTQPEIGPHAFAVYDDGTRTIMVDCNILSKGADTVSPWNYKSGMYYMADCSFSGSVDFVCPRGWCLVKNSKFYEEKKGSASIWHAGSFDRNQKLVLENCSFDGVEGFDLGRHHLEAQFYLLNCTFSKTMSDTPIYRVVYSDSAANQSRPFNWGERDYFYNCHKDGGDYPWLADNLKNSEGNPAPEDITPSWTFGGKWDPESAGGPTVVKQEVDDCRVLFTFSEPVTVVGTPILKLKDGTELRYNSGGGTVTLRFDSDKKLMDVDFSDLQIVNNSDIGGTIASVHERKAVFRENPSK